MEKKRVRGGGGVRIHIRGRKERVINGRSGARSSPANARVGVDGAMGRLWPGGGESTTEAHERKERTRMVRSVVT